MWRWGFGHNRAPSGGTLEWVFGRTGAVGVLSGGMRLPPIQVALLWHPVGLPSTFLCPCQQPQPDDAPQVALPHCHVAHFGFAQQALAQAAGVAAAAWCPRSMSHWMPDAFAAQSQPTTTFRCCWLSHSRAIAHGARQSFMPARYAYC